MDPDGRALDLDGGPVGRGRRSAGSDRRPLPDGEAVGAPAESSDGRAVGSGEGPAGLAGSPRTSGALSVLVDRLPASVRGGTVDSGRRAVGALALVGLVAALVAAFFLWRSRPVPVAAPPPSGERVAVVASSPSPSAAAQTVVVDVGGKVRHPGVFTLPAGSRVIDAVEAAGGAKRGADTTGLNLARRLADGEQVLVGVPPPGAAAPGGAGPAPGAPGASRISLNTATAEQLEELPDVGPVLAQRIVDYRTEHGGFRSVEELLDVSGIGDKTFAGLKDKVTV